MRAIHRGLALGLVCALAVGAAVVGCTALKGTGQAVYTAGSVALKDYCALPPATRAVGQLVLVGKVYNTGVCDVVNGDVDLQAQLASATAAEINALIAAKVQKALDAGKIDKATADVVLAGSAAYTTAAAEAVGVTATAAQGEKAAAIVTDTTAPAATPAPAASAPVPATAEPAKSA